LLLIQVIPFTAGSEPAYLELLARGLADLAVLRLNAAQIEARVNLEQAPDHWRTEFSDDAEQFCWQGQELWLAGKLQLQQSLVMDLALYDPQTERCVYQTSFAVAEENFLPVWEEQLSGLIGRLCDSQEDCQLEQALFTKSLAAFLEFRKGLETLAQTKNQSQRERGLENLLNAVAYDPDFSEAVDILLLFVFQSNIAENFEYYLNLLERLRRIANPYPRIPTALAEFYFQLQDFVKTEQLLQELVAEFPDFTEGWIRWALFYHSLARYEEALTVLQNLLEREADNVGALDLIGAIYAGMGRNDLARESWLKALKLDVSRVNVLNNLGLLAEEDEAPDQAERYYQQAISINDEWWGSYYNYGSFCRRQGRIDEATVWLGKASRLNPGQFQIFLNLGLALFDLGRYQEAQETLLHLLQIAPDNTVRRQGLELLDRFTDPEVKLGLRLRQLEKLGEAKQRWQMMIGLTQLFSLARHNWYYWYLWGHLAILGRWSWTAKSFWQTGLKYAPGFPLLKELSLFFWRKKQFKKALPLLQKAYQLNHCDHEIVAAYLQTLTESGETAELRRNLQQMDRFSDKATL
jgi:tetratricopeptide (TPR) repeat protein